MSSRFGAANPRRAKNAKLKIMLGSVVFLLVILLLVLVYVLQNNKPAVGTEPAPVIETVTQPNLNSVGVLVPLFRIESGQKLTDEMFKTVYLPQAEVPANAFLANEKNLILEKFANRLINPNIALTKDDVSETQPLTSFDIPVGYRLITILVDSRSGVEGYAKAGARVDVLWTFVQEGKKKIATLARFVKVISLAGNSQQSVDGQRVQVAENKQVTVSLLVTEKQAKYLELARSTGELSLVLVGGTEPPPNIDAPPEIIDAGSMMGAPEASIQEPEKDGVMIVGNDRYELISGKWKKVKN